MHSKPNKNTRARLLPQSITSPRRGRSKQPFTISFPVMAPIRNTKQKDEDFLLSQQSNEEDGV